MPRPVFSKLLALLDGTEPSGTYEFGPPPPGSVWVVRQVDAVNDPGTYFTLGGFRITDEAGGIIFSARQPFAATQRHYAWSGRQVIEPGGRLVVATLDSDWAIRVSGYELTP